MSEPELKVSPIRYSHGVFFWEGLPDCSGKKCVLFETCQYPKVGICKFRRRYISIIEGYLMRSLNTKDAGVRLKIGTHLVPLYSQLFIAKMDCIKKESRENLKEVRDILRNIEAIFRTMDGAKKQLSKLKPGSDDEDYYERISNSGMEGAEKAKGKPDPKYAAQRAGKRKVLKPKPTRKLIKRTGQSKLGLLRTGRRLGGQSSEVSREALEEEFGVI